MSTIKVIVSSSGIQNASGRKIYYTTDLVNFTEFGASDFVKPQTTLVTFVTDENKIPMLMVQYHESEQQILLCWKLSETAYYLYYVTHSSVRTVSRPLFPDSTCTKTTAHLAPPNS